MAATVATYHAYPTALEPPKRDTQPPTYPLVEQNGLKTRIRALVGFWEGLTSSGGPNDKPETSCFDIGNIKRAKSGDSVSRDLFEKYGAATSHVAPPPSYEDCLSDVPPDYTATDASAIARVDNDVNAPTTARKRPSQTASVQQPFHVCDVIVDFGNNGNIRMHAKKKKKQAANNWADSDNEKEKEKDGAAGGAGGDENAGGDAGGGGEAGGAGGDPPGGGDGGEDGDDWFNAGAGGKKSKKKKKKNAWEEFEEDEKKRDEEEKKAAEEEAAANEADAGAGEAEPVDDWGAFATVGKKGKKKKGAAAFPEPEPEPEPVVEAPAPPPADDDGWGGFTTAGKKKKGKKGKDPEPEPEPPKEPEPDPIADTADASAGADDWGGFATVGKKKKGKKGADPEPEPPAPPPPGPAAADDFDDWMGAGKKKKDKKSKKNEPAVEAPKEPANDMNFDDINLNDDKAAPKLDLDFGLGKKADPPAEKSSGFSFGWGSGWGGGSSWGFGGASDPPADPKPDESGWGFSSSGKKDKKDDKKKSGAFDFSFDNLDEPNEPTFDLGAPAAKDDPNMEEDPWGGFTTTTSKKDKKKKKGAVDPEPVVEPPPPPAEEKPEDDPWSAFSTKKDKKKKKGASMWEPEPDPEPVIPEPEPEPPKEEKKEEEDPWGGFMSAKDKKKAKKAGKLVKEEEKPVEVPPPPPPEPEPLPEPAPVVDAFEGWGMSTSKKDKKKKKGAAEPEPIVEVVTSPVEEKPADEDPWGSVGTKKDKKKKGGFSFDWADEAADPVVEVPPPPPPAAEPTNDWLSGAWADTGKKSKKNKKGVIEEVPLPPPPPPAPAADEGDGAEADWFGGFGTKRDKKKKGKTDFFEPVAPEPSAVDNSAFLMPEAVIEPKADGDDDWTNSWSTGTKKKDKKNKDKSKGITEVVDPSPGASVLLPESVQEKSAEEDPWSSWTTGKKAKKKDVKKSSILDPIAIAAPPEPEAEPAGDLLDMNEPPADDPWSFTSTTKKKGKADKKGAKATELPKVEEISLAKTKSKDSKKSAFDDILGVPEEAPPEPEPETEPLKKDKKDKEDKASSGWGIWGSTTKAKKETPKEKKEREKKEQQEREAAEAAEAAEAQRKADEEAFAAALADDPNEILDFVDEPAPAPAKKSSSKDKDSKKKGSDKLSKIDSKSSKKSEPKEDPVPAIVDVPEPDSLLDFEEPKKADGWGFWGSSLKSSAKGATKTNNKIGSDPWANQDAMLTGMSKMPDTSFALPDVSSKSAKGGVKGSTIQDRIKALGADPGVDAKPAKSKKGASWPPPPPKPEPHFDFEPDPEPEPIVEVLPPPVADKKSKKSATTTKSSSQKEKRDLPPVEPIPPPSVSPVPGGFPIDDFADELEPEMVASPPKKSSKDKKVSSKSTKKETKSKAEPAFVDAPPPVDFDDLMGGEDLPTPPPEDSAPKEKPRSTKKERPKVVRDQQTSSWGFWGATPAKKKDSNSKDSTDSPAVKARLDGLSRSKSARKSSDKDPLEKASKSSSSDKDAKRESKSRPSTSRGFSLFGMGAPPSRSKSTRQPSSAAKSSSRRHSTAIDESGLMSPPPEREMAPKAARVTGLGRSKSTRERSSRKVPDPYSLDSDDLVMADGPEDSAKDVEEPRKKKSSKSKRQSTHMSGGLGPGDDEDMVDVNRNSDEAKVFSGPDDLAFVERPAPVRRATSSAKKTGGLMGGILGAFGSRPTPDRRQSKAYESEDGATRRKRGSGYDEEQSKRLRREDRKVNRSRKPSEADATEVEDAEAKEARRRERRERREREAADDEARAARRQEKERARAREEEERLAREDERRREEKQARRAEREARRAEEDRVAREDEQAREERRQRRREKERQRAEEEATSRLKTDRRRSYVDTPDDEEARRARREERRMRRSVDQGAEKERPRASRRRSDYPPPVNGYFDQRNGEPSPVENGAIPAPLAHAIKTGGDKTASWVNSVNEEPPPPPPVEGTIVDAPLHFAQDDAPDPLDDLTAREFRHRRRRERDGYPDEDSERRRRRRYEAEGVKSSDGSSHDRRKSYAGPSNSMGYNDMGPRASDGRPGMPSGGRKTSWLKKMTGFP